MLAAGDQATGVPVLSELYGAMAMQPVAVDLNGMWRQLGVVGRDRALRFDETAPEAAIRRAIATPPPPTRARSAP